MWQLPNVCIYVLALALLLLSPAAAIQCPQPHAAANFTTAAFGAYRWREIGKFQTYNPFEAGCTCTTVEYFPPSGIFSVGCAKSGSTEVLNATLVPRAHAAPGQFVEKFHLGPFTSSAHLTIVALGVFAPTNETYMIEFDCSIDFGIHRNYCYHAFTPSGHASPALTAFIQQKAQKLGLNPDALQWDHTDQTNCPHV